MCSRHDSTQGRLFVVWLLCPLGGGAERVSIRYTVAHVLVGDAPVFQISVAVFGAVAWNRIRRWSAADFAVGAAAAGAGFNLCEDLLRRVATAPSALAAMFSDDGYGTRYGWTLSRAGGHLASTRRRSQDTGSPQDSWEPASGSPFYIGGAVAGDGCFQSGCWWR